VGEELQDSTCFALIVALNSLKSAHIAVELCLCIANSVVGVARRILFTTLKQVHNHEYYLRACIQFARVRVMSHGKIKLALSLRYP